MTGKLCDRLGNFFEKPIFKLGLEFWYSFSENWDSYRFLGVESIFLVLHSEKVPVFRLLSCFQDGRRWAESLNFPTSVSILLSWNHLFYIILIMKQVLWLIWTILVFHRAYSASSQAAITPKQWNMHKIVIFHSITLKLVPNHMFSRSKNLFMIGKITCDNLIRPWS